MKAEKLAAGDAALLAELESAAFEHPWSEAEIAAELAKPGALALALRGPGRLEAAALFSTVLDEAELLRVATRPERRRAGHAKTLLGQALDELRAAGIAAVFLEVGEGNQPARRLYLSLDFEEVGRRPAYYRDGAAALLYRRRL